MFMQIATESFTAQQQHDPSQDHSLFGVSPLGNDPSGADNSGAASLFSFPQMNFYPLPIRRDAD
jgi:hypothetical protein